MVVPDHALLVFARDDDYFGAPLNRVARLLGTAHGGQSLLSQTVYELALDSILIPVLDQEGTIRETVASALAQEAADIEVVVVDNASTDATPQVLAELHDERLRVVRNPSTISMTKPSKLAPTFGWPSRSDCVGMPSSACSIPVSRR